ncbi:hypothetical protein CEXT_100261 [Caerostris extrusa]|uniref:Uncharacterized protein n=1 Tax=Caerostris extrusa TaxID=172846 RepID=A0AAV4P8K3_CAEEX|nr:hypothetical protein CEXT_100261 [Caerostris extrusa]
MAFHDKNDFDKQKKKIIREEEQIKKKKNQKFDSDTLPRIPNQAVQKIFEMSLRIALHQEDSVWSFGVRKLLKLSRSLPNSILKRLPKNSTTHVKWHWVHFRKWNRNSHSDQ